jgi:phenol 2-monooxygenase
MLIKRLVVAVDYGSSLIVAKSGDSGEQGDGTDVSVQNQAFCVASEEAFASKLEVGKRVPSVKVLNQSDARPSHFQELLKSNGRWRVAIFPGDIRNKRQKDRLDKFGQKVASTDSFLKRFTPTHARYDAIIELLVVHAAPRSSVTVFDFPEAFRPYDEMDGWDYWKIFVDDESYHEGHGELYENFGIDCEEGCSIIIRPDQYLSYVGPMDAYDEIDRFFSGFMVHQSNDKDLPGEMDRARITL